MPIAIVQLTLGEIGTNLRNLSLSVAADEWGWDEFEVATGVTADDIFPQNITTIDVLFIESSQDVTVFKNSSATADPVDGDGVLLQFGTAITALTITNASGSTAKIKLGWWGT